MSAPTSVIPAASATLFPPSISRSEVILSDPPEFTEKGHVFVSLHLVEEVKGSWNVGNQIAKRNLVSVKKYADATYDTLSGFPVVDGWKIWENFKMINSSIEVADSVNLLVTVEDTGVGIPRDAQSRIFTPFMQADSSTSRTYGGTGIGLSISKCLVHLMGGEIGFVSESGTGSTFSFTSVFREGQWSSGDMKRHPSYTAIPEFQGLRSLVVDGRSVRAEVTKYHLQRLGIKVDIVISPESLFSCISNAWNSRASEHIDMVLVDEEAWNDSSDLSLLSLVRELRQKERVETQKRHPKLVILSTSRHTETDEMQLAEYIDSVVLKPLRLSMMSACLRKALGVGNKREQSRKQPLALCSLLNGKHILVVDDNVVNRRVAAGVLEKYAAKVTCVNSGKAAVEMLQPPHKFDACFMDVQMPEMDGFEATRQIRSIENKVNKQIRSGETSKEMFGNVAHWHIPILAMTADVIQATHDRCVQCGMDDYVSKPFEEEQLYSAVAHFFEADVFECLKDHLCKLWSGLGSSVDKVLAGMTAAGAAAAGDDDNEGLAGDDDDGSRVAERPYCATLPDTSLQRCQKVKSNLPVIFVTWAMGFPFLSQAVPSDGLAAVVANLGGKHVMVQMLSVV
ncbi:hypothetical protein Taro_047814 [Colocasia esculenta]|uniref:histidine kinase n=1 Tax=Colocasia esculenta TaxID=4460 RepID=A0A843WWZ5_COLES|nr:hypothetical protein [Colocasia esculenta]